MINAVPKHDALSVSASAVDLPPDLKGEDQLVLAVAQGNRAALKDLMRQTSTGMLGWLIRRGFTRDVAEDILQDVYVKIWQHAPRFDPDKAAARVWTFRILKNRAIDKLRQTRRRAEVSDDQALEIDIAPPHSQRIDEMDLENARRRLSPEQNDLIDLLYRYGMTQSEVSQRLQIPVGTVKSRLRRAIETIRDCMRA